MSAGGPLERLSRPSAVDARSVRADSAGPGELRTAIDEHEVISRAIERLLTTRVGVHKIGLSGSPVAELPPHVIEAAEAATRRPGYAPSAGEPEFRLAVAERLTEERISTEPSDVLITNGAMQALDVCFRTLLRPGDKIVMPAPGFFIGGLVRMAGGRLATFPSPEVDRFRPQWTKAAPGCVGARALFLNSPVNPTGYMYDESDLEAALALAVEHDLWIISDESYAHFAYDGRRHQSIAALPGAKERTIVIRSFSKDYAMPGWRLGYLAAPTVLAPALQRCFEWSCLCVNRVAQAAGLAALTGPQEWIQAFVTESEALGQWFAEALSQIPGLRCVPPLGGLNVLVGVSSAGDQLVERLVLESGIPAHPGEAFGAAGYFRLQFGAKEDVLRLAVERTADIVGRPIAATNS